MSTLRPNILFMLSDDHATEAVGAYRERLAPWAQTVRIDRLASQMLQAHAAMNHSDVPAQYEGLKPKSSPF